MLPTGPNIVSQAQGIIPASEVAGTTPRIDAAATSVRTKRTAGRLIGVPLHEGGVRRPHPLSRHQEPDFRHGWQLNQQNLTHSANHWKARSMHLPSTSNLNVFQSKLVFFQSYQMPGAKSSNLREIAQPLNFSYNDNVEFAADCCQSPKITSS